MKKVILIICIILIVNITACRRIKLLDSVEILEDPNIITIIIEKKHEQ